MGRWFLEFEHKSTAFYRINRKKRTFFSENRHTSTQFIPYPNYFSVHTSYDRGQTDRCQGTKCRTSLLHL